MEIRHYEQILGVIPVENVVDGRFGVLTSHTFNTNYGSDVDLPGWKTPDTANEAKDAKFLLTWPVDNRPFPNTLLGTWPSISYSMRPGGFDMPQTWPITQTIYGSNPANTEGQTIPSGYKALAFKGGIFTFPSGAYIYNAGLRVPGAPVAVADTASDSAETAGMLKYAAVFAADTTIGRVLEYNSTTNRLTVLIDE